MRQDIIKLRDFYDKELYNNSNPDLVRTMYFFKVEALNEVLDHIATED